VIVFREPESTLAPLKSLAYQAWICGLEFLRQVRRFRPTLQVGYVQNGALFFFTARY